jgi:hypothetical protein
MTDDIRNHLDNPRQLEKLYRANRLHFKREFVTLYPQLQGTPLADYWHERLNYEPDTAHRAETRRDLLFLVVLGLVVGTLAKLPEILGLNEEFFYSRNVGFLVFPALAAYFARKNNLGRRQLALLVGTFAGTLLYINLLPNNPKSDTLVLACMHLMLFLWAVTGFSFVGSAAAQSDRRLGYLRFNGDLIVICTVIMISGGLMTAITINLFTLIDLKIEDFYFKYIVIFGLPSVPLLGTYLIQTIPQLVQKVSPVIARLFSPVVLVMLLVYLGAIVFSGKDPYTDRDFLIIFNLLLVGVMALIFFSIAESHQSPRHRAEILVLFLLSAVTVLVNGIALSAILFRISECGLTPNRAAVLGSNLLILINLLIVVFQLFKVLTRDSELPRVGKAIADYLPVYLVWAAVVTFLFPLLFGFK